MSGQPPRPPPAGSGQPDPGLGPEEWLGCAVALALIALGLVAGWTLAAWWLP